jgi:hypothetical protein
MAMAVSTRTVTTLGVAAGAGVLAGAGQLGVGYGLGILRWDRDFTADTWHTQLAWVAFLSAVAVVCGVVAGRWRGGGEAAGAVQRAAVVGAATLGSLVVLPLVIRPAATSHLAETGDPRLTAAITSGAGLALGVLAAVAVLTVPVVSGNITAWIVWVWLAGTLSAVGTLSGGASWGTARPGLLPATGVWVPVTLLGASVLIAAAVAGMARMGGNDARFTGVSGAAGPVLLGAAYLVAGPGAGVAAQAYRYALVAVLAGAVVSVLIAVLRRVPAITTVPAGPRHDATHETLPEPVQGTIVDPWESPTLTGPASHTPDYGWPAAPDPVSPAAPPPVVTAPVSTPASAPVSPPAPAGPAPAAEPPAAPPKSRRGMRRGAKKATVIPPAEPVTITPTRTAPPPAPPRPEEPGRGRVEETGRGRPEETGRGRAEETTRAVPEEPAGRAGRRSRRRADDGRQAPESDYVDWVKGLSGGGDGVRVGGAARHAKPGDGPTGQRR